MMGRESQYMKQRQAHHSNIPATQRANRRGCRPLRFPRCWLGLLVLWLVLQVLCAPGVLLAQTDTPVTDGNQEVRTLRLVEVQLVGATRTPLSTVYRYLPLRPGQAIDQAALVAGVAELRAGGIFKSVSFFTRPGAERGQLILVLEVEELGFDFRWAAGNTNLDGWYLSPAMLAYDNAFGKGGLLDLQWRVGFRHTGLLLRYGQPKVGAGQDYWGTQLSTFGTDRPYYADGVGYSHRVGTYGLAGVYGRRFSERRLVEFGLNFEGIHVQDKSVATGYSPDGSIEFEEEISGEDLPPAILEAVGRDFRTIAHVDWQHDTRSSEKRAGSPVSGGWGRLKGTVVGQSGRSHLGLQADARLFRNAPGGVFAARFRGAWVGEPAAFYDRLYLGGMYSVRGFATHALSAPGGDTWLWSSSVEYRSRILGDAKGTKLAGVLFVDAGASGASDAPDPYTGTAVGAGYGLRLRVWWLDWVGLDVGFPVSDRPLDQRFQVTASIGWSF